MRHTTSGLLDIPATQTAAPQNPTYKQLELARSLACYCSDDDVELDRKAFISTVIDRIQMDILHHDY